MAERRMFAQTIVNSDSFLDMPLSAQALYFHLCMRADDDGFVNNPKRIQRVVGASDNDLRVLISKNFLMVFESGVVVIKHWRMNNSIRKDRKKDTAYKEEFAMLNIKDNGAYTFSDVTKEVPADEALELKPPKKEAEPKHHYGKYEHVMLTDKQYEKLVADYGQQSVDEGIKKVDEYIQIHGAKYKDHNLVLRKWGISSPKLMKSEPTVTNRYADYQ